MPRVSLRELFVIPHDSNNNSSNRNRRAQIKHDQRRLSRQIVLMYLAHCLGPFLIHALELLIDRSVILFSVAAAATAASLLTGSSEPILSSGLASNPTADSTMNSVSSSSSSSSSSPTSTGDAAAITGANTPAPLPFHPATLSPRLSTSSASASSATVTPSTWIPDNYVNPSSSSSHVPSFVSASYTRSPISGIHDESSAGRTERMRQAWSTIRERLGLGGGHVSSMPSSTPLSSTSTSSSLLPIAVSGTSTTSNSGNANSMGLPSLSSSSHPTTTTASSNVGVGGTAATSSTSSASATANAERWDGRERERTLRADTREQMLAEMTRVFNNGFGLSLNASTPGVEDFRNGSRRRGEQREVPPEGSFERFLAELQTDMRIALIQGHQSGDRGEGEREVPGQQGREDVSANNAQETLQGAVVVGGEREHRENEPRSLGPLEESQEQEGSTDDDMPSLQDVSNDSSSENHGSCFFFFFVCVLFLFIDIPFFSCTLSITTTRAVTIGIDFGSRTRARSRR